MGKKLTKQEKLEKINNNFELWCKNFVKIVDNERNLVDFVLNDVQKDLYKNLSKYNVVNKSRQLGISSFSLAYSLWYACTKPNSQCLLVSFDGDSTHYLFEKLKSMYSHLPEKYVPKEKKNNKMELHLENDSKIMVRTVGNNYRGLGRSKMLDLIHISEYAFIGEQAQKEGLLALEQSLSKGSHSCLIIESTSYGYNYWYTLFMNAYRNNSKYRAHFYPFHSKATIKQFKNEIELAEEWFKENSIKKGRPKLDDDIMEEDEKKMHYELGVPKRLLIFSESVK